MTTKREIRKILRGAAKRLQEKGWTRFKFLEAPGGSCCASGAIRLQIHPELEKWSNIGSFANQEIRKDPLVLATEAYLAKYILDNEENNFVGEYDEDELKRRSAHIIQMWNDSVHYTGQDKAIKTLLECAKTIK